MQNPPVRYQTRTKPWHQRSVLLCQVNCLELVIALSMMLGLIPLFWNGAGGEIKWSSAKFEELLCSLFWWTLVCWQYSELCVDLNWTPYVILNPGMLRFLLFYVTSCRTQNRIFWSTQEYSHNTTLSFFTFFSETETVFKKWSKSVLS